MLRFHRSRMSKILVSQLIFVIVSLGGYERPLSSLLITYFNSFRHANIWRIKRQRSAEDISKPNANNVHISHFFAPQRSCLCKLQVLYASQDSLPFLSSLYPVRRRKIVRGVPPKYAFKRLRVFQRCDGQKPKCSPCLKSQTFNDCEYKRSLGISDIQSLENQVSALEARLKDHESGEVTIPQTKVYLYTAPSSGRNIWLSFD